MNDDAVLLRRYAEERSEVAFAELVHRHVDLVYTAALRRLGGDVHRAADVAQQVFTTLARDAKKLCRHSVLTAWLYTATRNAAIDLIRSEQRRRAREQQAFTMQNLHSTSPDPDWDRLRPVLDGVMDELDDADRTAVLLRFFEKRSFGDIGTVLHLSEDAARMRVDRALDKLRMLLAKHEITSTAAALATVLGNQAIAKAPEGLAASIAGAALSGAAVVETGALAVTIAFMTATKTTVTLGVAAALTLATAIYQSSEARATAATLAAARREHAAVRGRVAELGARVRVAEQAVADREKAKAHSATDSSAPNAAATAAAKVADQKALQQYLDSHPELRMAREAFQQANSRANHWPVFLGLGLTPEQAELAQIITQETNARRRTQLAAGMNVPPPDQAPLRAAFGDAAAERMNEFNKVRWEAGALLCQLSSHLYHADEPFTPQQKERMIQIFNQAKTAEKSASDVEVLYKWDQILAQAEPVLSPAQMRGLRAMAGRVPMKQIWAAATKEAAAANK